MQLDLFKRSRVPGSGKRRLFRLAIVSVVVLVIVALTLPSIMDVVFLRILRPPGNSAEDQLSAERVQLMTPERLVRVIAPPAGATVLDLGAGYGLFTFPLAEAVGETGRVFATDVDPRAVDFLSQRAQQAGLKQVDPYCVSVRGFDRVYRENTFDVVLAADVVPLMYRPAVFFGRLKSSLKKETGRLWIVNMRLDPDFAAVEFADFASVLEHAGTEGDRSPIVARFSAATRDALAALPGQEVPEALRVAIVEDLNRMLEDATLWRDVQPRESSLDPHYQRVRERICRKLDAAGAFRPDAGPPSESTRRRLRLLNRLVIQDLLGTRLWLRAFALDKLSALQWGGLLTALELPFDFTTLFQDAGYELIEDHQTLTFHDVWEFKRAD